MKLLAKFRRKFTPRQRRWDMAVLAVWTAITIVSCSSTNSPHRGRFPFSMMEKPPAARKYPEARPMEIVLSYQSSQPDTFEQTAAQILPGDVVGLVMSHRQAWGHLRKGKVQKIPYELFRFGHVALAVPNPKTAAGSRVSSGDLRFLNVAMNQAVEADEGIEWLRDQSWMVYRPPAGSIDVERLREFTKTVCVTAGDRKKAYDYSGAFGVKNVPTQPQSIAEIESEYTCATLIVAGLDYSGFRLRAVHRGGVLDVVTPRQVLDARGETVVSEE